MKRTAAIITSSVLGLLFIGYISIWYILSNNLVSSLLRANEIENNSIFRGNKITVKDVSISGFPFKIGAKASSISEETKDGIIYHKGYLYVGYDLLNQKLYSCYDGSIGSQSTLIKNNEKNLIIECKSEIHTKIKMSFAVLKILLQKDSPFELVNFIKGVENSTIFRIYDADDKSLLLDQIMNVKIDTDNTSYYHNIDELMLDDIKHKYHITSNIATNKNSTYGYKIPRSIFYPTLQEFSLNSMDFDCTISSSFKNRINDSEIHVNRLKYDSSSYNGESSCYAKIYINKNNVDIDFKLKDSTKPKEGFYDQMNKSLFVDGISNLITIGVPAPLVALVSDISANPEKYYFPKTRLKSIDTKFDISFVSKDEGINLDIKQFDIFFDDAGIKIADKIVINPRFAFATKGILSIKHSDNILEYWSSYLLKHFAEDNERIVLLKTTLGKFLRSISNHPESTNDEIFFDFSLDSVTNDIKIGGKTSDELLSIYKQYLYQNALDLANSDPNFMTKAAKIIPELMEDKALIQKLQNASGKAPKDAQEPEATSNTNNTDESKQ